MRVWTCILHNCQGAPGAPTALSPACPPIQACHSGSTRSVPQQVGEGLALLLASPSGRPGRERPGWGNLGGTQTGALGSQEKGCMEAAVGKGQEA